MSFRWLFQSWDLHSCDYSFSHCEWTTFSNNNLIRDFISLSHIIEEEFWPTPIHVLNNFASLGNTNRGTNSSYWWICCEKPEAKDISNHHWLKALVSRKQVLKKCLSPKAESLRVVAWGWLEPLWRSSSGAHTQLSWDFMLQVFWAPGGLWMAQVPWFFSSFTSRSQGALLQLHPHYWVHFMTQHKQQVCVIIK